MITESINKPDPIAHFQQVFADLDDNDAARQIEFEKFLSQGWPHRRMENWRYTSLQKLAQTNYPVFQATKNISFSRTPLAPEKAVRIIIQAGQWQCLDTLPEGLNISEIETAAAITGTHPLAALNGALHNAGIAISIAENIHIDLPIYILHHTPTDCADSALHMRHRISVAQNASVEIVEHYISEPDIAYHHNIVTEINLDENAQLTYHKIQAESLQAYHTALFDVSQAANAKFCATSFSLGGQLAREDIQTNLGEKAICHLRGAYIPRGTQHVDHHLDVTHSASLSESEMHFKGVLNDKATAVFNGKVLVKPNIQKISAIQKNNNLLLSLGCEVNSKPELEIYSDDIRCTHGATIGHIDPAALFYLRARGLSPAEARLLIITAFIQTEIDAIKNAQVREFIGNIVMARLHEVCHGV